MQQSPRHDMHRCSDPPAAGQAILRILLAAGAAEHQVCVVTLMLATTNRRFAVFVPQRCVRSSVCNVVD